MDLLLFLVFNKDNWWEFCRINLVAIAIAKDIGEVLALTYS